MSDYVLEIEGLTKRFPGTLALDNVQLKIRRGTVHALAGENGAGKSTLMKCLLGVYNADSGKIILDGKPIVPKSVKAMHEAGLSIVEQELSPVLDRSVMENIWLGRQPMKCGIFINYKEMYNRTKEMLKSFRMDIDPKVKMSDLSVAQMQMIEIIKATYGGVSVVMMDEPTSALTEKEVAHLFEIIRRLKERNVSVIYVTHKMDEIYQIADEVTVMRDGKWIASHKIEDVTMDQIVREMVGRNISGDVVIHGRKKSDDVVLKVDGYSDLRMFKDVSFELHKGEVLGFAGLVGAGRTELMESVFGLRKKKKGSVEVKGKRVEINTPRQAIANGMVLLTEERRKDGIFPVLSILQNIIAANYKLFVNKFGFISSKGTVSICKDYIKMLNIKTPSWETPIQNLSGGNQQKVLFARALLSEPDIFILDEPTRGIDVGSKSEIHNIINDLACQGKSVIVVSSELPELLKVCDRIAVMREGVMTGMLKREEATQEKIMMLASMEEIKTKEVER